MAPSTIIFDHHKMSPKEKNKLRKPAVEKMRRDRINSSIEQLKILLEKEFHKEQPNVKLEKADVLEMTVTYLRKHRLPHSHNPIQIKREAAVDFKDGYSRCFDEVLDFLSVHPNHQAAELKAMNQYKSKETGVHILSPSSQRNCKEKQADLEGNAIWRPW